MSAINTGIKIQRIRPLAVVVYCLSLAGILVLCLCFDDADTFLPRAIVLGILLFCIVRGSREKTLANPFTLFSLAPFSILIYSEKVSSYYLMKLDSYTWMVAIVGMISFLLALQLFHVNEARAFRSNLSLSIPARTLPAFSLSLIAIGLVWAIAKLPLYSIVSLLIYPGFACAMASKRKGTIAVSGAMVLAYFAINTNKSIFLSIAIAVLLFYELFANSDKGKLQSVFLIVLFGVLMVAVVFPLKSFVSAGYGDLVSFFSSGGFSGNDQYEYYAPRVNWKADGNLFLPYMYLVTPWCNLQYVIQGQGFTAYGLWFIKPLLGYLQMDGIYDSIQLMAYSTFNTFTFFGMPFADLGIVGVLLESFAVGLFVKYVYIVSVTAKAPLALGAYSLVACAVLEMFFSNHFFGMSYPFTIVIIVFLFGVLFRRKYGLIQAKN